MLAPWKSTLVACSLAVGALAGEAKARAGFRDLVGGDQIYLNKKDRFIKFDAKDNELEIELGVSVPVVKVPLGPKAGRHGGEEDSLISISAPGLVVAGALFVTSFFVLPLLFPAHHRRSGKMDEERVPAALRHIRDFRSRTSSGCVQNLICRAAKKLRESGNDGAVKWLDDVFGAKWMKSLIGGTLVEEAIQAGRNGTKCSGKYSPCPFLLNNFSIW